MKKLRLIVSALLASTMICAVGCDKNNQTQKDSPVISIAITGGKTSMEVGETLQLGATVTLKDATGNTAVTWSSTDSAIASVSSTGLVTALKAGTVTIKAKSVADSSKVARLAITISNAGEGGGGGGGGTSEGFYPDLLDEGYEFSETYPEAELKEFLGVTKVINYGAAETGYYYISQESQVYEETVYAGYFTICFEYSDEAYEGWLAQMELDGFKTYYDSYYGIDCGIDPTKTYELDVSYDTLGEEEYDYDYSYDSQITREDYEDESLYVITLTFYLTDEVFYDGTKTADTAWSSDVQSYLTELGYTLPFVKMGENYQCYYDEDNEIFSIFDYSYDFDMLNGYPQILLNNGFEKYTYPDGEVVYTYTLDQYTNEVVEIGFDGYGNEIYVYEALKPLDNFPSAEVEAFVKSEAVGSKYSVPAYDKTTGAKYTYSLDTYADEDTGTTFDAVTVGVDEVSFEEAKSYTTVLADNGYSLVADSVIEQNSGCSTWTYTKGKIVVSVVLAHTLRDATEEDIAIIEGYSEEELAEHLYDIFVLAFTGQVFDYSKGELQIAIYGDLTQHEEPGIYATTTDITVKLGKDPVKLDYQLVDIEGTVSFESQDEDVCTVSEDGYVTGVAAGTTTIVASITDNDTPYSVTYNVIVKEVQSGATFDFSKITTTSGSINGFSFKTAQAGNNSSAPAYNDSKKELRLYINNTITFTSTTPMTSIFFDANTCGESKATGTLSCDVGVITEEEDGFYWTGNATSVTFTVNSGKQVHINNILVNGGGEDEGGEDEGLATCASVCEELSYEIFGENEDLFYEYEGYYYAWAEFDEGSDLLECVEIVASLIPETYLEVDAPYEDVWDDETDGAFACYCVDNIVIELGAYDDAEYECVTVQICVYEA